MTSNDRLMNRIKRGLLGRSSSHRNSVSGITSSNRPTDATYFLHITEEGEDAISASGEAEEDKGRGERLALLQGVDMGDYSFRAPVGCGWRRGIFFCKGEVFITY